MEEKHWYVIHTYSGYENKVKANLESRVHTMGMEDLIFNVVVPLEDETEVKDGKQKTVKRKVFPGYALVEMIVTDRSWYVVRNTPGVTGFVGSGTKPIPLTEAEVAHILKPATQDKAHTQGTPKVRVPVHIDVRVGESVRILAGSFEDHEGKVASLNPEQGRVEVLVDMFGRETSVEVDYTQVERI